MGEGEEGEEVREVGRNSRHKAECTSALLYVRQLRRRGRKVHRMVGNERGTLRGAAQEVIEGMGDDAAWRPHVEAMVETMLDERKGLDRRVREEV